MVTVWRNIPAQAGTSSLSLLLLTSWELAKTVRLIALAWGESFIRGSGFAEWECQDCSGLRRGKHIAGPPLSPGIQREAFEELLAPNVGRCVCSRQCPAVRGCQRQWINLVRGCWQSRGSHLSHVLRQFYTRRLLPVPSCRSYRCPDFRGDKCRLWRLSGQGVKGISFH